MEGAEEEQQEDEARLERGRAGEGRAGRRASVGAEGWRAAVPTWISRFPNIVRSSL